MKFLHGAEGLFVLLTSHTPVAEPLLESDLILNCT